MLLVCSFTSPAVTDRFCHFFEPVLRQISGTSERHKTVLNGLTGYYCHGLDQISSEAIFLIFWWIIYFCDLPTILKTMANKCIFLNLYHIIPHWKVIIDFFVILVFTQSVSLSPLGTFSLWLSKHHGIILFLLSCQCFPFKISHSGKHCSDTGDLKPYMLTLVRRSSQWHKN